MDTLKRIKYMAVAILVIGSFGCEESGTGVEPPPPPLQITLEKYNILSPPARRLPDNEVYDIFVDSQNRIWFSTNAGVAMKDGANDIVVFDNIEERGGLPHPFCRGIAELNGKIFVGTWGGGVAVYDGSPTWTKLPVRSATRPGLVNAQVFDIAADDTSAWIGTVNGLSQYIDNPNLTESQRWIDHSDRLGSSRAVTSVLVHKSATRGDEVWATKRDGGITVIRFPGTVHWREDNSGIPSNEVREAAYSSVTGLFWVALATKGLASVDVDASLWKSVSQVDGLQSDLVASVAVSSGGLVWVATQTGPSVLETSGRFSNYVKGSGLPEERVRKVFIDGDDGVWLGFIDGGAARVTSRERS